MVQVAIAGRYLHTQNVRPDDGPPIMEVQESMDWGGQIKLDCKSKVVETYWEAYRAFFLFFFFEI